MQLHAVDSIFFQVLPSILTPDVVRRSGTRKMNPESTTTLVLDCGLRHNDKMTNKPSPAAGTPLLSSVSYHLEA